MLAAATGVASGLFGKSSTLSAYTLHSSTPTGSPATSSTNLPSLAGSPSKGIVVGLWRVVGATHKTTNKDVSVWIFDKKVLEGVRGATQTREWAIEQLKKEVRTTPSCMYRSSDRQATSLSRLRHPDLLHMVEPLEETRSELTFVTEYITSSLANLISAASTKRKEGSRPPGAESSTEIDLDEVEIQKGTLQIAKALIFLHQQAKMVHLNITPDAILINAKVYPNPIASMKELTSRGIGNYQVST
jgi:SCY1-like protein 2